MNGPVGFQARMDAAIDEVLTVLDESEREGVELDPLATIVERMRARGAELDLDAMPPMLRMLFSGMIE